MIISRFLIALGNINTFFGSIKWEPQKSESVTRFALQTKKLELVLSVYSRGNISSTDLAHT